MVMYGETFYRRQMALTPAAVLSHVLKMVLGGILVCLHRALIDVGKNMGKYGPI